MDWFNSANLGIFIHWGLYAVPAFDNIDCAKMRTIQNGSEWYYNRLTKTFRVSKSDMITKDYHKAKYGDMKYEDFINKFTGEKFNADEWCKFIKTLGAKYIVITAKHHDGFCLWNTKTTKFNVMQSPMKKDVIKELRTAAYNNGLKFGIYYSWMEFNKNITVKYKQAIMFPQLYELLEYKPDLFWFDGDWTATHEQLEAEKFLKVLRSKNIIYNSRLGKNCPDGSYSNHSDRYIATTKSIKRYEGCWSIGYSWGYNKQQKTEDYKTGDELLKIYNDVTNTNGNLLLNIGPRADGTMDPIEKMRLMEFSMKKCKSI